MREPYIWIRMKVARMLISAAMATTLHAIFIYTRPYPLAERRRQGGAATRLSVTIAPL